MRNVIFWTIALTLLFYVTSRNARADSLSFKYGLGLIDGAPNTRVKAFGLRFEEVSQTLFPLSLAVEGGLWTDTGSAQGRKGSAYGTAQVGIRPQSEHVYVKAYIGPCAITEKDSLLGGYFPQFKFDTGFGFQDRDAFVGINVSHISSAGLYLPNKGRDAIQMEAGIRW